MDKKREKRKTRTRFSFLIIQKRFFMKQCVLVIKVVVSFTKEQLKTTTGLKVISESNVLSFS